jgi:molecular chaperone DnaK (HSP70)
MIPQRTVHPDEAVALGCAVQVGIIDGENEGLLGRMQAVLSPMQAAVMRALAKKRGIDVSDSGELAMMNSSDNGAEMEMIMAGGISGLGGDNMMIVDEFDDEDDFY